jgi:hypothetical protein
MTPRPRVVRGRRGFRSTLEVAHALRDPGARVVGCPNRALK